MIQLNLTQLIVVMQVNIFMSLEAPTLQNGDCALENSFLDEVYKLHNEIDHDQINYCKLHFSFSASSSCFKASIRSTKAIFSWKFQDLSEKERIHS